MGRTQNKGKLSEEWMSGESKGSRISEDCRERQKGLMEKSSLRWVRGAGESFVFPFLPYCMTQ